MAGAVQREIDVDVLSKVLRSLRLRGSIYVMWDLRAPWGIDLPAANNAPFHYLESGECSLVTEDGRRADLGPGDFVALFDGAGHRICDSPRSRSEPLERIIARAPAAVSRRYGGKGRGCSVVCGKFAVDEPVSAPATLRHLPRLVHIPRRSSSRVRAFAAALELLASETQLRESGSERAASLLTELLLIQVVRAVLNEGPTSSRPGWLEGLRDPQIGISLAAIHNSPGRPWSLESLAAKAGLSRSVFAERFAERLGRTPMSYLSEWRLHMAAQLLRDTSLAISEVHQRVGYASAASFDRAFKRAHGVSPSMFRAKAENVVDLRAAQSTRRV